MIQVSNLVKKYQIDERAIPVLNGVTLTIQGGEFVAIQGPSGAGKSTLLHLVGGIDRVSEGEIVVNGRNITVLSDEELAAYRNREIGFVFQAFHLEPTYTALENVMLPLVFAGVREKERKERALRALEQVGLQHRSGHIPGKMSGGERQRVSIARAIINQPQILLADEPTGNLDSKNGQMVMDLLKQLNQEHGYTIVMVTHNAELAAETDRVIYFKDGQIS